MGKTLDSRQSYTSGQEAKLCGLGISTIKRWVKRGALKAYRTPGGDLRILRPHLIDFMREFEIPLHRIGEPATASALLLAVRQGELRDRLLEAVQGYPETIDLRLAEDDLELGSALASQRPSHVITESQGREKDRARLRHIRQICSPRPVRIGLVLWALGPAADKRDGSEADVVFDLRPEGARAEDLLDRLIGALPSAAEALTRRAS